MPSGLRGHTYMRAHTHLDSLPLLLPKSPWEEGREPASPEFSHPPLSPQPGSASAICGDTCRQQAAA